MGALVNMGVPNNPASAPPSAPPKSSLFGLIYGVFSPWGAEVSNKTEKFYIADAKEILEECRIDSAPSRFLADLQAKHGVPKRTFGSAPPTRMEIKS